MNDFDKCMFGLIIAVLISVCVTAVLITNRDTDAIKEAILRGNDPLRVMCAFKFDRRMEETCKLLAEQP